MMLEPARDAGDVTPAHPEVQACGLPSDGGRRQRERWRRRRLLERQLHDGPALRIAAVALQLGLLGEKRSGGQPHLQRDVDDLQAQLHAVLEELRAIADRIYPPLLYETGLGPALRELAGRAAVELSVDVPDDRFDRAVEATVYFAVLECLDVLQAGASTIELRVRRETQDLMVDVVRIGRRPDAVVIDQLRRLGEVTSILVEPTTGTITMRVPCG